MAGQQRPRAWRNPLYVTGPSRAAQPSACAHGSDLPVALGLSFGAAVFYLLLMPFFAYAEEAMMVRIAWGGGAEKQWQGSIAVSNGTISQPRPLGIEADEEANRAMVRGQSGLISRSAKPAALVLPTNEEWMIARDTEALACAGSC